METICGSFVWDSEKERDNLIKHGVDFVVASTVFEDPKRKIFEDLKHSSEEPRYFCVGSINGKILTVRFTYGFHKRIRIYGAGYWRKGRKDYEKKDS